MDIDIVVAAGDAFDIRADVLVAKYAQQAFGLDQAIVRNITNRRIADNLPECGEHRLVTEYENINASIVLFVGVEPLHEFRYSQIRDFARRSLSILREEDTGARHIALTLHGVGYGLDESESFKSEIAGLLDAVTTGQFPQSLQRITIIESDSGRASRLQAKLQELVPTGRLTTTAGRGISDLPQPAQRELRSAGYGASAKPHIFVAMPFAPEFDDLYYYGIQGAVNKLGYLCERADLSSFTGDVMNWVQSRISSARLVVADLTGANPNVYLEVGYAWALKIPTILLAASTTDLKFDVRGQRIIEYKGSIRALEQRLAAELSNLNIPQKTTR